MPACGGGGATAWRTAPLRSRSAAPFSPAPRRGGGGSGDRVPGAGELPEVVEGGFEIIDGERSSDVPVQMSGEGAAVPEDGIEATGPGEAAHRDSARCGSGGRPTTLQRYATPIVVACAQTRSGKVAAFYFLAVSGPVAAAAAGGGRRHGQRDQGSLHRSTELRALVATHGGEFAAQMMDSDLLSKCMSSTVGMVASRTDLIVQKIEFLNDGEKRSFLLDLLQCNQSVDMASVLQHPLEMKQGADLLWFYLFSKGFPATEINGDRTHQVAAFYLDVPVSSWLMAAAFLGGGRRYGRCDQRSIDRPTEVLTVVVTLTREVAGQSIGSSTNPTDPMELKIEAIKFLVMDERERVLDMGCDAQKTKMVDVLNSTKHFDKLTTTGESAAGEILRTKALGKKAFLCWTYISSFGSWSRVYLFIIIFLSLIPRSSQIPVTDNTTNTCPAPFLHAEYLQFKRSVPTYGTPLFEKIDPKYKSLFELKKECPNQSFDAQMVSAVGGAISLLANFEPFLLAWDIGDANPIRPLLVGLSTLLYGEANMLWFEYLLVEECAARWSIILAFTAILWNLIYTIRFWYVTSLDWKQTATILFLCSLLGILGYVDSTAAGIFGLTLISLGHTSRIISVLLYAREFNWFTLCWSLCGAASGSVLYKYNFEVMALFKIASLVSFGARVIDIVLQLVFYYHRGEHGDTNDRLADEMNNMLRDPLLDTNVDEPRVDEPRVDEQRVDEPMVDEPRVDEPMQGWMNQGWMSQVWMTQGWLSHGMCSSSMLLSRMGQMCRDQFLQKMTENEQNEIEDGSSEPSPLDDDTDASLGRADVARKSELDGSTIRRS